MKFNHTQMQAGFNRVQLVGICHESPEIRYKVDGARWVRFRLQVTEHGTRNGSFYRHQQHHSICCFAEGMADLVYGTIHVGDFVMIEGRIVYGKWQDKDGRSVSSTSIFAGTVLLLTPGQGGLAHARNLTPCPDLIDTGCPVETWEEKAPPC